MTAAIGVSRNSSAFSVQRQTEGVHDGQDGFRNLLHHVKREERRECAQKGRCDDWPATQRLGRRLANEKVADDAAAGRRGEGHDDNAKGVQPFHRRDRRALNRQDEGSRNIDALQQSCMARGLVIHRAIMARLLGATQAMAERPAALKL